MVDDTPRHERWDGTALRNLFNESDGTVDPRIYTDAQIYDLEMERLFGRSWLFLAHESQLRKAGDYFTTYMGEDPVVVVGQRDGTVKAFLNQCRHRGMRICRTDGGNARSFTCSYHGWAYDLAGNLVNVPFEKEAYGRVDKAKWSPVAVPRIEHYKGLIFGNWDAGVPSLVECLGEATYYMDTLLDRVEGGTELLGGVHKWVVPCNWKFAAEQFCSDMYHVPFSHLSAIHSRVPEGVPLDQVRFPSIGRQFRALWGGHGAGFFTDDEGAKATESTVGPIPARYLEDTAAEAEARLGHLRANVIRGTHMTVFPTLSFLPGVNTIRVWHPRGPQEIEIWAFTIVDRSASEEVKEAVRVGCLRAFSPSGMFEQDDGENWIEVQRVLRGHQARKTRFNVQMGMGVGMERGVDGDDQLPGDVSFVFSENAARGFYRHWLRMMTEPDWSTLAPKEAANVAK